MLFFSSTRLLLRCVRKRVTTGGQQTAVAPSLSTVCNCAVSSALCPTINQAYSLRHCTAAIPLRPIDEQHSNHLFVHTHRHAYRYIQHQSEHSGHRRLDEGRGDESRSSAAGAEGPKPTAGSPLDALLRIDPIAFVDAEIVASLGAKVAHDDELDAATVFDKTRGGAAASAARQ